MFYGSRDPADFINLGEVTPDPGRTWGTAESWEDTVTGGTTTPAGPSITPQVETPEAPRPHGSAVFGGKPVAKKPAPIEDPASYVAYRPTRRPVSPAVAAQERALISRGIDPSKVILTAQGPRLVQGTRLPPPRSTQKPTVNVTVKKTSKAISKLSDAHDRLRYAQEKLASLVRQRELTKSNIAQDERELNDSSADQGRRYLKSINSQIASASATQEKETNNAYLAQRNLEVNVSKLDPNPVYREIAETVASAQKKHGSNLPQAIQAVRDRFGTMPMLPPLSMERMADVMNFVFDNVPSFTPARTGPVITEPTPSLPIPPGGWPRLDISMPGEVSPDVIPAPTYLRPSEGAVPEFGAVSDLQQGVSSNLPAWMDFAQALPGTYERQAQQELEVAQAPAGFTTEQIKKIAQAQTPKGGSWWDSFVTSAAPVMEFVSKGKDEVVKAVVDSQVSKLKVKSLPSPDSLGITSQHGTSIEDRGVGAELNPSQYRAFVESGKMMEDARSKLMAAGQKTPKAPGETGYLTSQRIGSKFTDPLWQAYSEASRTDENTTAGEVYAARWRFGNLVNAMADTAKKSIQDEVLLEQKFNEQRLAQERAGRLDAQASSIQNQINQYEARSQWDDVETQIEDLKDELRSINKQRSR